MAESKASDMAGLDEFMSHERDYLVRPAGEPKAAQGIEEFLEAVRGSGASGGETGPTWTRDELHER